jgi:hypothetical protein
MLRFLFSEKCDIPPPEFCPAFMDLYGRHNQYKSTVMHPDAKFNYENIALAWACDPAERVAGRSG